MIEAGGAVSSHAAHLGTLAGPVLLLAFWASWSELRAWLRGHDDAQLPTVALIAAALSIGAGVVHAIVIPPHVSESLLYGVFFAGVAIAQIGWAALLVVRPQRWLLAAGAIGNLAVVALWAVTRTVGVPLGVAAGRREGIGVLDTSCCILELGVIACCAALARNREPATVPA
jgi:hypothetical protein